LIEIARRRHKFLAAAKSARIPSAKPSEHNWFDDPKPKKIGFRDDFAGDFNFSGKNSGWGDSWG
jgi:hypothetical protein